MTQIALDTNIWIYLTKDTFFELWTKLKEMKDDGQLEIIVNDVILKEWERNKENTIKSLANGIKSEYTTAINLANYLEIQEKKDFLKIITTYKSEAERITKATQKVTEVEDFIKSCTIINVTEAQKLFVANLAIEKVPPFQNNKNNFNDALIFRNVCEYSSNQIPWLYDLIYVSNNPDDFIDRKTSEVHKELFEDLKSIRLKNVTQLGEALNLAPEFMEDFDDWLEDQLEQKAYMDWEISRGK
jgi:predicted nucleic acid-binding protein